MQLDELFRPANAMRWTKRGDKVSVKPVDRPLLHPLTKFEMKRREGDAK